MHRRARLAPLIVPLILVLATVPGGAHAETGGAHAETGAGATEAEGLVSEPDVSSSRCVVPADAAALPTVRGRTVATLHPHEGKVFYGYGDYGANTGSMRAPYGTNVSSFDPGTLATTVHLHGFKTEEVNTFRTYDGHVYVPSIDPSRGADGTSSFASDRTGSWRADHGASGPVHVYDVAELGEELFIVGSATYDGPDRRPGSAAGAATVWRSPDGGRTWEESLSLTEDDPARRNGYERFYWAGVVDGRLFVRPRLNTVQVPPMRMYDPATGRWSTPQIRGESNFGAYVVDAHDVVSWRDRLWTINGLDILSFDGTTVSRLPRAFAVHYRHLAVGDDDALYSMTYDGRVHRIEPPAAEPGREPRPETEPETETETEPETEPAREPETEPSPDPGDLTNETNQTDESPTPTTSPPADTRKAKARKQARTLVRRLGRVLRAKPPAKARERRIRTALVRHGRGHGNGLVVLRRTARAAGTNVPALARQQQLRPKRLRKAVRTVRVPGGGARQDTVRPVVLAGSAAPVGAEAYTPVQVATAAPNAASFTVARGRVWAAGPAGVAEICSFRLAPPGSVGAAG